MMWHNTIKLVSVTMMVLLSGCDTSNHYPQYQKLKGPWQITSKETTIKLDRPLELNPEGSQLLYLTVNSDRYDPYNNMDIPEHYYDLKRNDGVIIIPEVTVLANTGEAFELEAGGNMRPPHYPVGKGFYNDPESLKDPEYPENVQSFHTLKLSSNRPFTVNSIIWKVTSHPDGHVCGGRCPWWWDWVSWMW
ncbi:hypothetical protein [Salicola sp. Rm-C-2C1-2]|uniref:hypothetical protein n=1 Tax=Salicola sp. Rm-C-2C1-2 TaxID=3141321 RepID=UPI0032E3941B